MTNATERRRKLGVIIEAAALGSSATTVAGFTAAVVTFLCGELVAACLCLAAAALSLGLLANIVFIGIRLSDYEPRDGQ